MLVACGQGQLLYLAYNDYDMAEGVLSRALRIEPGHLLARMHLDLVRSLRRAAALLPYQPLSTNGNVPYAEGVMPAQPVGWDQVYTSADEGSRPSFD